MTVLTYTAVDTFIDVAAIPAIKHENAPELAQAEYQRVVDLLQSLEGDDWHQPTYCTRWNVRQMVAHLAGAVALYAQWAAFVRQTLRNPFLREEAVPIDAINRVQVEDRAEMSTAALVAEFVEKGPKAIRTRYKLPWLLRKMPIPIDHNIKKASIQYLMDVIYTRDQWMHRYDISAATTRKMILTPEHDGRMVELILRDVAFVLNQRQLGNRSIGLVLTGDMEGAYRFGSNRNPETVLHLNLFDFILVSSERISAEDALARATVDGDSTTAAWFLHNCAVPY